MKTLKWRSAFKENAKAKNCQGKKQKGFSSFLQNLSGASILCVRDEVFWIEDLIEETTKRLHDSYTILTLIEHDMSAQLNSFLPNLLYLESSSRTTHAGFRNEDAVNESAPYPELQEGSPDSNPDGRAQELAEPNGFKVEDLRRVLVRVGNLLECLYDGGIVIPDF